MNESAPEGLPFRHENRGRRPSNLLLLALVLAISAAAIVTGQGGLLLILAGGSLAGLAYFKYVNPRAGIEIDAGNVTFWRGRGREAVPVSEIGHVALREGQGSPGATIHRHDGSRVDIHRGCLPEPAALAEALSRAGVRVSGD